jgi:AmmeMemoRadiSam system protein A
MDKKHPLSTVDVVIELDQSIVLVERRFEPTGWALPGGFVDYGEPVEIAAIREVYEETGLSVELTRLLGVYSNPNRDPRGHTISTVFIGRGAGRPKAGDDAGDAKTFLLEKLPSPLCFDHALILKDYSVYKRTGVLPIPRIRLTDADKREILALARGALVDAVSRRIYSSEEPPYQGRLALPGACFVTLHEHGDLRGCIGIMAAEQALGEAIAAMAQAAALRDSRFTPVRPEEVEEISLEVSVLGPCTKIKGPDEIRVGDHGLLISKGGYRGVLLPQVASEHGWDVETFLRQTCHKAGLQPDAWKDPNTTVEVFTAEIVSEEPRTPRTCG